MCLIGLFLSTTLSAALAIAGSQSNFDPSQNVWTLSNDSISASFQLTPDGYFLTQQIANLKTGESWTPAPSRPTSPIAIQTDAGSFNVETQFRLIAQYAAGVNPGGVRQFIVLQDLGADAQITLALDLYDGQPALRYTLDYQNLSGATTNVTSVNLVPWMFADQGQRYSVLGVNQWSVVAQPTDFQPLQTLLDTDGTPFAISSGSDGQQCGWLALRDGYDRGLFAGWEFDGLTATSIKQVGVSRYLTFHSEILDLHHPVAPLGDFQTPYAFLGLFHGDWDEAGFRTQSFAETILAKPAPSSQTFPYVSWDSWGYQNQIDEQTLRGNADVAAAIGVQLFIVDLGWARSIGDWYADPAKFPNGLGALADYVHSLGMKFGLHFALAEADPNSPVLRANPDWTATDVNSYFNASPLCLSNQPTQDWLIQEGIRVIDDYHVDWILQDGQNMVKQCTKSTHTHDPADSNYANSVQGINAVVSAIQAARPNVMWENCENGGSMMTFNMVKSYVTSITNDASGALPSRTAVYGATYPFPPRYAERYMPQSDGFTPYAAHSYRFGGPWVLMNQLANLPPDQIAFLAEQVQNYKNQRTDITGGKVFHIVPPGATATDVIESYNAATDTAIAVVARAASDSPTYLFTPLGLNASHRYTVWFEIAPDVYSQSGSQLMSNGVRVALPTPYSSDVVHVDPQQ
jgi:hypothetical protein